MYELMVVSKFSAFNHSTRRNTKIRENPQFPQNTNANISKCIPNLSHNIKSAYYETQPRQRVETSI